MKLDTRLIDQWIVARSMRRGPPRHCSNPHAKQTTQVYPQTFRAPTPAATSGGKHPRPKAPASTPFLGSGGMPADPDGRLQRPGHAAAPLQRPGGHRRGRGGASASPFHRINQATPIGMLGGGAHPVAKPRTPFPPIFIVQISPPLFAKPTLLNARFFFYFCAVLGQTPFDLHTVVHGPFPSPSDAHRPGHQRMRGRRGRRRRGPMPPDRRGRRPPPRTPRPIWTIPTPPTTALPGAICGGCGHPSSSHPRIGMMRDSAWGGDWEGGGGRRSVEVSSLGPAGVARPGWGRAVSCLLGWGQH